MMKKLIVFITCIAMALGCFSFLPSAVIAESSNYKIVAKEQSGDYIISNINVSDFGAKGDGQTDDTSAIKSALSAAASQGGGVVFVPAGEYVISQPLTIGNYVTLCGVWSTSNDYDEQTVLICDYESNGGTSSSSYFIKLKGSSAVKNLNIYYSKQSAKTPVEYPYTIGTDEALATAMNITLLNSYNGIYVTTASHVENIYGTCFNIGFKNRKNYEISAFVNLNFSGKYLKDYDGTSKSNIKNATKNCKAIITGKSDDFFMYGVNIDDTYYNNTIYVELDETIPAWPKQAYGHMFQINGAEVVLDEPEYSIKMSVEDKIDGVADNYSHQISKPRFPAKETLYVVNEYGATGNGATDDTKAIKDALSAASQNGGGTVYVPVGYYKISDKIIIPENVELRGAWDSPMHRSGSVLCFYTNLPETDAMITLSSNSGIHGFTFRIPDYCKIPAEKNEGWEDAFDSEIRTSKYPWIIRGNGSGVWVENVTFINTYNGIDFASNKCDNFLIKGTWGTCTNQSFAIGGGSENGVIEYVFSTYGTWWEDTIRATDKISAFTYENAVALTVGNAKNLACFSVSTFGIKTSLAVIDENGKSVENMRIIRLVSDLPYGFNNVEIRSGNNIAIIGLSTGGGVAGSKFVKIYPTFAGKMRVYGQIVWGNSNGTVIYSDYDYQDYNEKSDEIDYIDFDFAWEKTVNKRGCGSVVASTSVLLSLAIGGCAVALFKRKK